MTSSRSLPENTQQLITSMHAEEEFIILSILYLSSLVSQVLPLQIDSTRERSIRDDYIHNKNDEIIGWGLTPEIT